MRKFLATAAMFLSLLTLSRPAYSQGIYANVTGTVTDGSGALIPGVTIKATNVDQGTVKTTVTNEAGAYNYGDLLPGRYTISASLPGFQTKNLTDVSLSQNTNYRYNFELTVAGVNTQVEVNVSAGMILATQGASVGQVLSEQKVKDLPLVGNNILDLITVMAGVENIVPTNPPTAANAFGRENTTFAGVSANNISVVRDGIQMQDARNPNGIYSITTINPDLVGEIRLILAPVDVEMGRGNGSIQYTTRSGTNKFSGSAVWSFRNTALDPNSWTNNRNQTLKQNQPPEYYTAAQQGTQDLAIDPIWSNTHQVTVSYGGPIIRNKTFFFALFDYNTNLKRSLDNFTALTPCARLGIYRYFDTWNSTNINGNEVLTGTQPTRRSVGPDGTPILPSGPSSGSAAGYDNSVQHRSVFGPLQSQPTTNDCSDAPINMTTLVPNGVSAIAGPGAGGGFDPYRHQKDPSGYITRAMAYAPLPNNYEIGDGLNTAGFRWLRRSKGIDNLFGSGEATGERKQINVKVDHNFTQAHKANVNVSYEKVLSDDFFKPYPDGFSSALNRFPFVVSGGFTSTLSPTLLNEARVGFRYQRTDQVGPWWRPEYESEINTLFPADVNGFRVVPNMNTLNLCNPHGGLRVRENTSEAAAACSFPTFTKERSPTWTFSDTVSWTHGAHSFRFNGELRLNESETKGFPNFTPVQANVGSVTGTAPTDAPAATSFSSNNTTPAGQPNNFKGLLTNSRNNGHSLMNYLAGSLNTLQSQYYLNNPNLSANPTVADWADFRDGEFFPTRTVQPEFSAWAKDEWKISRNLTLTPGIRWDYFGVMYLDSGLTSGLVGGSAAAFGISGRDYTGWMNPGVRGDPSVFEFVGPNSPNPNKGVYPEVYHNFGPSLAFAYTPSWLGEGRTTIRGGYQITYQGGGRFGSLQGALTSGPGRTLTVNYNTASNIYLDLTTAANTTPFNPNNLDAMIPIPPTTAPLGQVLVTGPRNTNLNTFDPHYTSPYVQNLTLSVTRTVNRNVTVDLRYIGTLSRKTYTTQNLNINNFLYNGLGEALDAVRRGDDANAGLLDQIFNGVNLCTTAANPASGGCTAGSYGPINGTTQTAATQIRAGGLPASGATSALTSLVNLDYNTLAGTITNFNYAWGATGAPHTCAVNCGLPDPNPTGPTVNMVGAALRVNAFPENFIRTNPQFGTVTVNNNNGYNNYHSLQAQVTMRPVQGFSGSVTYNWSKNLGLGTITNPVNRADDYYPIGNNPGHTIRTNGTVELPLGPNKLLFGNSSGWLARAVERWQLGLIYNLSSGYPTSITADSLQYGNGLPDVRHPVDFNKIKGVRWGIRSGNFLQGRYFDNGDTFVAVDDPVCGTKLSTITTTCTLNALAMVVPAGTPDSAPASAFGFPATDTRTLQIVLQHPELSKKGNLGNGSVISVGQWRFDANLGKTFQISESKSLQIRIDAQNVMNHPQPGNPNLNINAVDGAGVPTPFGQIATKSGGRVMQGQLRLNF